MRTTISDLKILIIILSVVVCYSFISLKVSQTPEELIIGTWKPQETQNAKWVFKNTHRLEKYYDNVLEETYTWSINTEVTTSGLKVDDLELINTQNSDEVYNYEVLSVSNDSLVLIWYERPSNELIFTKP